MTKPFLIAVDFDGTIVEHQFPDIGPAVPGAFDWLARFQAAGAKLILWTMRSDGQKNGDVLTHAVEFCRQNGIEFHAINDNPTQSSWTNSRKVYANLYIDDAALGCPLKKTINGKRAYVNWEQVGPEVMKLMQPETPQL